MPASRHRDALEHLYRTVNRRRYVHPDPLECLYAYEDPSDREVAALVASGLAYGRVRQILRSAGEAMGRMGPSPARFVADARPAEVRRAMAGLRHRWTTGEELAAVLSAAGRVRRRYGSLRACFAAGVGRGDATVLGGLRALVGELAGGRANSLLPDPAAGSACKRLFLMLRWLIRRDDVDLGDWSGVPPRLLVVPLDTHMLRIGRTLGLTARRDGSLRTAMEITDAFRSAWPEDPVRFDFSLTRLGLNPAVRPCEFLTRVGVL